MQQGEQTVAEIRRHPIGIISVYVVAGLVLAALAGIIFGLGPHVLTSYSHSQVIGMGAVAYAFIALLTVGFLFIANIVYWGNRWVITTDSITQITQTSLFNTQSSQLSLGNLEDISAEKNGILTHIFNYGVLKVETAGEHSKFQFIYCPDPNTYAQKVIAVREQFEQKLENREGNTGLNVSPAPVTQQQAPPQPQA
ncbi:MAG: hypothetical protein JWO41_279 [Candidatus Saccharibacteria bacterium]|nr:hypothetical protein [Candidatus Saccharibacteria bacterium]